MGDLNTDMLVESCNTSFVKDLFKELSLQVINHHATRRPPGTSICKTWIDVICVDNNDTVCNHQNKIPPFMSDHNLIEVEIQIFLPRIPKETFSYRKLNSITPEAINEVLSRSDWRDFSATDFNIDTAVSSLTDNIRTAIDELAPLKTINPKKSKHPWIDDKLKFLICKRKSIERRYLNSKDSSLLSELLQLTEVVESLAEIAHNTFIRARIDEAFDNTIVTYGAK